MNGILIKPSIFGRHYNDGFQKIIRDFKNDSELSSNYFPTVDVVKQENSINFSVELPGVKKEDVKIVLEDGILSISGEKKNHTEENDQVTIYRNERRFGTFERKFKLQDDINSDDVKAKFENGVLNVSVALVVPEPPKEKVIEIN